MKPNDECSYFDSNIVGESIKVFISSFINRLITHEEILGVVILGGLGQRNFFDEFSDVDIALFVLDADKPPKYLPPFEFSCIVNKREILFNIHQQGLIQEKKASWDKFKREAYSHGRIVCDKAGELSKLIQDKTNYSHNSFCNNIISLAGQIPWYISLNPPVSLKRGMVLAAHDLITTGIRQIVEIVYALNSKFPPHSKWFYDKALTLDIVPENFKYYLQRVLLLNSFSEEDVKRRMNFADELYSKTLTLVKSTLIDFPEDPYLYACKHLYSRQLLPDTFADKYIHKRGITGDKARIAYGLLSINLIDNEVMADKMLQNEGLLLRKY